jgi:muramidase (phage lysozyme)
MNWYKQAQQKNIISKMVSIIGMATVLLVLSFKGMTMQELSQEYQMNPQKVIQEAKQIEEMQFHPKEVEQIPIQETSPKAISGPIDLDKIWTIESSRGTDPRMNEPNTSGALGHFQFLKGTWDEMVSKMGKDWDWKTGALDYNKSRAVADYYFNKRIPQMLNYYKIPDTVKTRIACYSWGIGHLKNEYENYKENWERVAPQETIDYFAKYGV